MQLKRAKSCLKNAIKDETPDVVANIALDLFKNLPSATLFEVSRYLGAEHSSRFFSYEDHISFVIPKKNELLRKSAKERVRPLIPANLADFFESQVDVSLVPGDDFRPFCVIFGSYIHSGDETLCISISEKYDEPFIEVSNFDFRQICSINCKESVLKILSVEAQRYREEVLGPAGSGEFMKDIESSQKAALFDYYFVQFGLWITKSITELNEIGKVLYDDFIERVNIE